jgi:hypothetical protein
MANIIQIKRGNGPPNPGDLKVGELGWDRTNKTLYIGEEIVEKEGEPGKPVIIKLATAIEIKSSTEE